MGPRARTWWVLPLAALALVADARREQPRRGAMLGIEAHFDDAGARLTVGAARDRRLTIGLAALGRPRAMRELRDGSVTTAAGPEVRITRAAGIVEWWRSSPSGGLEQGVTIAERPAGAGVLRLDMRTTGARAELASDDEIMLRGAQGEVLARYAHLVVLDAAGQRAPARLAVAAGRIRIEVDDRNARYPLVIDPLVIATEEATLLASDGTPGDYFASAVALSADGTRALVGAYSDDTTRGADIGSAHVYLRTGTTWTEEATLLAPDGAPDDAFGSSVALSADGSRALVGVLLDDTVGGTDAGSARVFVRTGTTWTEEATLLAAGGAADDYFGWSVALSADGSRALVGAYADDTAGGLDAGSARVFVRSGTTWTEEATLLAAGGAANDAFGNSVALSSDASRALIGAYGDSTTGGANTGSARVFLRTGTVWTEEATLLAAIGGVNDAFGISVTLSSDGSRALVGACQDDTPGGIDAGSARVFLRTGTTWGGEATFLAAGGAAGDNFGISVRLSADGSRALVGAYQDDTVGGSDAGSARVLLRTGTTWTEDAVLLASDGAVNDWFGNAVALTGDGTRALVGSRFDDTVGGSDAGSARVFTLATDANGTPCTTAASCLSGFCIDGVCCENACGGGATPDCQACATALTGLAAGTCAALSTGVAPTVTCRAAVSTCDVAEVCVAAITTCPVDAFAPAGSVCRAAATPCDATEVCTGTSAACPADVAVAAGGVCRPTTGSCDIEESCDGASFACPADARIPAGVVCRSIADACDLEERCTGVSAVCPADAFLPAGSSCRPAVGPCDLPDTCTGTSAACLDAFQPAGTVCNGIVSDVCDAPDHCTGSTGNCPAEYLSGVECRAASGACDIAEVCAGTSPTCPPDAILSAGVSCRASTDTTCDPEETCDGVARACPADVTTCAPRPDAGAQDAGSSSDAGPPHDSGLADDASTGTDAGPPVATGGCCRAAGGPGTTPGAALVVLVLLIARRRTRYESA